PTLFLGNWSTFNGTQNLSCPRINRQASQSLDTDLEFDRGTGSDVDVTALGCVVRANVSGSVATILPGQMCTFSGVGDARDETDVFTYQSGSFTINPDGVSARLVASGTVKITAGVLSLNCTFTLDAPYEKN